MAPCFERELLRESFYPKFTLIYSCGGLCLQVSSPFSMSYLNEIKQHLESLQRREGSLAAAILGLDAALATHRAELSPQLQHYLSQRSYDKALAWVSVELAAAVPAASGAEGTTTAIASAAAAAPSRVADTTATLDFADVTAPGRAADNAAVLDSASADAVANGPAGGPAAGQPSANPVFAPPPGGCGGRRERG